MHPENSKKWIEDARLHTPLPHLYNLQGETIHRTDPHAAPNIE